MNRRYYSFTTVLVSPLSLSSGLNENTDSDVLLDSRELPYIPATSIAGVLASRLDENDKKRLYGKIGRNGDNEQSHIIFYDAQHTGQKATVTVRDSVALENKVGKDGAKFDFEIVEPGAQFKTYIELDDTVSDDDEALFLRQLAALNSGILRFGRKTTRGYGQVKLNGVKRIAFTDSMKWLDFDMYDDGCWAGAEDIALKETSDDTDIIKLKLKLKSALSIRAYTTELPKGTDKNNPPDYKYLSIKKDDKHPNGIPVISGTTWAGAFRDRFTQFTDKATRDELFGYVEQGTKKTQKSKITFSESVFEDGSFEEKSITRNSIDRFSAATNDGALYTELTVFGGSTELTVTLPNGTDKNQKAAVLAAIADLHNGFMAIGGLTSVGRGLFEVETLSFNGEDVTEKFKDYDFAGIIGGERE